MRASSKSRPGARRLGPRRMAVESLEPRALLATFTVTDLAGAGPGTLREAIERANLAPGRDTIDFAPGLEGTIELAEALPALSTDLDIEGPGASVLTVSRSQAEGTPGFRVFTIRAGARVALSGLTVAGGAIFGGDAPEGEVAGGGIWNAGTLTLSGSTVSGNRTIGADVSKFGGSAFGGGVWNSGTMTVVDSTFTGNVARGGTITLSGATAPSAGGALWNTGTLTVSGSTFAGNTATESGGIENSSAEPASITNSTISGNAGSGVVHGGPGTMTVRHATFSGNSGANLRTTGPLIVGASLFAEPGGGNLVREGGTVTSEGRNLFSDRPGAATLALDPTDLTDADPRLAPLGYDGGPTPTHALRSVSPAIDAAAPIAGITADQRGVPRPQGSAPDIGAVEQRGPAFPPTEPIGRVPVGVPRTVEFLFLSLSTDAPGPLVGLPVRIAIVEGPNAGGTGTVEPADGRTDSRGRIRFTYTGPEGPGVDQIVAVPQAPVDDAVSGVRAVAVRRYVPGAPADYDGDGRSDFAVYAFDATTGGGLYQIQRTADGSTRNQPFGGPQDRPLVGDFDGDGITDLAVFGSGRYALIRSSDGAASTGNFGGPDDVPVVGDYDGDGRDDLAVYGPGTDGFPRFAVLPSSDPAGAFAFAFGGPGDVPLAGDYDGDGRDDLGVYGFSPLDGFSRFAIRPSAAPDAAFAVAFGGPGDTPAVGDYDGDLIDDVAVYGFSPLDGFSRFAIRPSGAPQSAYPVEFGGRQDAPIAADYDGDGTTDVAVFGFSPDNGLARFAALRSADGRGITAPLGTAGSVGLPVSPGRYRPPTPGFRSLGVASAALRAALASAPPEADLGTATPGSARPRRGAQDAGPSRADGAGLAPA